MPAAVQVGAALVECSVEVIGGRLDKPADRSDRKLGKGCA
jgi:hypothetical protein